MGDQVVARKNRGGGEGKGKGAKKRDKVSMERGGRLEMSDERGMKGRKRKAGVSE